MTRELVRFVAVVSAVGLVAVGCGQTGDAAATPSTPGQRVGAFGDPARLGIAPDGSRSVVALQNPQSIKQRRVVAWHAKPGSRFGPTRVIARSSKTRRPFGVDVAADGDGIAALGGVGSDRHISVVTFGPSGATEAPVTVSGGGADLTGDLLDVADSGAAVVVWTDFDRGLFAAIRDPGNEAFGAPVKMADVSEGAGVTATIGDDGTVVAAWTTGDGGQLEGAVRPPGGVFGTAVVLDPSGEGADTFPVSGPNGRGLLVWQRLGFDERGRGYEAWYVRPTDARGVGPPYRLLFSRGALATGTGDPSGPTQLAAAIRRDGTAIVAFPYSRQRRVRKTEDQRGQLAIFAGSTDRLRRVATLGRSKHGFPTQPKIAIGPDDVPIIAWNALDARSYRSRVVSARAPAGTTRFGTPRRRSPGGYSQLLDLRSTVGGTGLLDGVGPGCETPRRCTLTARRLADP